MKSSRRGMTLIELLVAMVLMAALLVALLSFVFSMTEIWGQGGERRLFGQHVDAVSRHMESMLRRAALPAGGGVAAEAFTVREISPPGQGRITGLGFTLNDGDRLLTWSGQPVPLTECVLSVEPNRGLVIYWRSALEAEEDDWRDELVTPLINAIAYRHLDARMGSWRTETSPQRAGNGGWIVPEQIVLRFAHDRQTAERILTLPLAPAGIPLF